MTTPEEAVRLRLLTLPTLTALVATRVYLDKLPQSPTYPAVRVLLVSDFADAHLRGGTALRHARVQVDAYAKELSGVDPYALAVAVGQAIHGHDDGSGLSGWRGVIGTPPLTVQAILAIDRRRYYDPEELRVLTISQDYRVWFQP